MQKSSCANNFRNELINKTVLHAASFTTFYGNLYRGIDLDSVLTVDDLARLPTVDKDKILKAGSESRATHLRTAYLQNTSGSSGAILVAHRSENEAAFISAFFTELLVRDETTTRPLVLSLYVASHGTPTQIPGNVFVVTQTVGDARTADNTRKLLETEYDIPGVAKRVSIIIGGITQVFLLTSYLLEKGFDFAKSPLSAILVTGEYLPSRMRLLLEQTWGAALINRYSLSEHFGAATSCSACGEFHFDPYIVAEILEPSSETIAIQEYGELTLTSLFPFVQQQPLIRYRTGDWFSAKQLGCPQTSYSYIGRASHILCHPDGSGRILITGPAIYEALDIEPAVRKTRHSLTVDLADHTAIGKPIAKGKVERLSASCYRITLLVELVVNPFLYLDYTQELKRRIERRLVGSTELLRSEIERGTLQLSVDFCLPDQIQSTRGPAFEKQTSVWE